MAESFFAFEPGDALEPLYSQTESVSVDFGIMEKARNVYVMEASFRWSDMETWTTLYDATPHTAEGNTIIGQGIFAYDTHNSLISIPPGLTAVIEGLDGYIVSATPDTLLICRRQSEEKIFKFSSDVELQKIMQR